MAESIGFSDILNLAQTIGILGTMIMTLHDHKKNPKVGRLLVWDCSFSLPLLGVVLLY
jgi:hypothetical protein